MSAALKPDEVAAIRAGLEVIDGGMSTPERKPKFTREKFSAIEPTGSEWLVKHFLPAHGTAIIAGPSTVGKSFVVLYFALRIARGNSILGHRTRRAGVLYFAAEGQNGMRKRVKAVREKYDIPEVPFELVCQAPDLRDIDDIEEMVEQALEANAEMQESHGVELGLIVIDTLAAAMPGGNENAGEDMSRVLAHAQALGLRTGALVVLVGHTGKNEALGVRGWSGQIGNTDAIIYLSLDEEDPSLRTGLVHKLKDGESGERFAFRLKSILLGYDADGDAITSAYPSFEDTPNAPAKPRRQPPAMQPGPQIIMRAMRLMLDEGQGELVPAVPGVPPGTMGVKRTALRARAWAIGYDEPEANAESVKRSVNRDIMKLISASAVRSEGEMIWPTK